jgi:NAD(P)-dependent dehydrogenase (short-subunit alcohol dehydrogenase family)
MDNFEAVDAVDDMEWHRVFNTNIHAPYHLMQRSVKLFLNKKSGNIINIASVGGLNGGRAGAAYTASKFALIGLTKNTGYLFAKKGIRCNAIAPGAIETNISETIDFSKMTEDIKDRIMPGMVLNPRNGKPLEIAKIALFLASEESSFINGSVIVADEGWTAY